MLPRFTIKITDNKLGKFIHVGVEEFEELRRKTISGKSLFYDTLDRFEEEVLGKTRSNPTK